MKPRCGHIPGTAPGIPLLFGLGLAFSGTIGAPPEEDSPVKRLATWLEGSYTSQAQARADSAYLDIGLHMVRIWKDRADGPWLYVEQATAAYATSEVVTTRTQLKSSDRGWSREGKQVWGAEKGGYPFVKETHWGRHRWRR